MSKLKFMYETDKEKDIFIKILKEQYRFVKVSKEYRKEGPYKRIYIDLKSK